MTTEDKDKFGFGVMMNDGSELIIDTPEKLDDMIKTQPDVTHDIIILLASRLYQEAEICKALEQRLAALSDGGITH